MGTGLSENGTGFVWQHVIWGGGRRGRRGLEGGRRIGSGGVSDGIGLRVESENGRGFVWRVRIAQEAQVPDGAPVGVVVAGFVALEEGEGAGVVGVLEGGGQELESVAGAGTGAG